MAVTTLHRRLQLAPAAESLGDDRPQSAPLLSPAFAFLAVFCRSRLSIPRSTSHLPASSTLFRPLPGLVRERDQAKSLGSRASSLLRGLAMTITSLASLPVFCLSSRPFCIMVSVKTWTARTGRKQRRRKIFSAMAAPSWIPRQSTSSWSSRLTSHLHAPNLHLLVHVTPDRILLTCLFFSRIWKDKYNPK
ncbi:hypothetical protein BKA80DRAFT_96772 [Phyllosticta citrichinensis]